MDMCEKRVMDTCEKRSPLSSSEHLSHPATLAINENIPTLFHALLHRARLTSPG